MPKAPKLSAVPPLASPCTRPLCALRYLVRLGESITVLQSHGPLVAVARTPVAVPTITTVGRLALGHFLVLRHRVVSEDLALEHPHLDAAGAIGGLGRAGAEIDVGAQRVQRHAALAVPLHPRDLGAAEPAAAIDADA